jgi:hypothetical protein
MSKTIRGFIILLIAALVWGIGNAVTGFTAAKYIHSRSLLPAIDISLANTAGEIILLLATLAAIGLKGKYGCRNYKSLISFKPKVEGLHAGALRGIMPGVHRIASLLKPRLLGTHQGSVTAAHLDAYLNEFAFRFYRRHSRRRGLSFSGY